VQKVIFHMGGCCFLSVRVNANLSDLLKRNVSVRSVHVAFEQAVAVAAETW